MQSHLLLGYSVKGGVNPRRIDTLFVELSEISVLNKTKL
jgi:hypothetical protein